MSIQFRKGDGIVLVSHEISINSSLSVESGYSIDGRIFDIQQCFVKEKKGKSQTVQAELLELQVEQFLSECKAKGFFSAPVSSGSNHRAVSCAAEVAKIKYELPTLNGENTNDHFIKHQLFGETYLIPPHSKFYNMDIQSLATTCGNQKFDLIVIDPPWPNRFIKRLHTGSSKYSTLEGNEIANMPIESMVHENSIIVIWCTNSTKNLEILRKDCLPKWELKEISEWKWIKVTKHGNPICPFQRGNKKKPYERLLVAVSQRNDNLHKEIHEQVIVSIPSALHSHKPPVRDLFFPILPENPTCLEIFARSLQPSFTSFGNEVLKLQNIKLYREKENESVID